MANDKKAVVHVSGTLLRRNWYGKEMHSAVVIRPGGKERDSVGYVVSQVRFKGPTELRFDVKPREQNDKRALTADGGFVGALPGFDGAVLVYLQADEDTIEVQPEIGGEYVSFPEFRQRVAAKALRARTLDPRIEDGC